MKILIVGAGILGEQVFKLIQQNFDEFTVEGFIDNKEFPEGLDFTDTKILGNMAWAEDNISKFKNYGVINCLGQSNLVDRAKATLIISKWSGVEFPNIIHPKANISKCIKIGKGNLLLAGTTIDQDCIIGDFNYFDIGTLIGHACHIANNNVLAAGAIVASINKIGSNNFLGINCSIVDKVDIGDSNFIGASTVVYKSISNQRKIVTLYEQGDFDFTHESI